MSPAAAPRLSVLLLTEDGGTQADETLRSLVVKLLGRVEPGSVTREDAQSWEPATPEARAVARANGWKDPRRRDLVSFRQYIASKLRRTHGFVFFHVDGDRPYRERDSSENLRKLDAVIRKPVGIILEGPPPQRRARAKLPAKRDSTEVELDELPKPKDELCFGDAQNGELAGAGYPLDEVLGAEKSLHDALQALRSCSELVQALQRAMPSWKR